MSPPDDDNDNDSIFDHHLKSQHQQDTQDDTGGKKRKRNTPTTNEHISQSAKLARNSVSQEVSNAAEPSAVVSVCAASCESPGCRCHGGGAYDRL